MMSGIDTRSGTRDSLFLLADLTVDGESAPHRVKIRNLSTSGLMAEGDVRVQRGTRIRLDCRSAGMVAGVVAWCEGSRFGVALQDEIDPAAVREALMAPREKAPEARYAGRFAGPDPLQPDPRRLRTL